MRLLIIISHFYKAKESPVYTSNDATKKELKKTALRNQLLSWRRVFGSTSIANLDKKRYESIPGKFDVIDIVVASVADSLALPEVEIKELGASVIFNKLKSPMMLPFVAHKIIGDLKNKYDYFVFSEDDLRVSCPLFFSKMELFETEFGPSRLLMPNRFEINENSLECKTYIDGDIPSKCTDKYRQTVPDSDYLVSQISGFKTRFQRALNPHSGIFILSNLQVKMWVNSPNFLDYDVSWVSPLESAATLSMMKNFSIYKPYGRDIGYLEIEHMDHRWSSQPYAKF